MSLSTTFSQEHGVTIPALPPGTAPVTRVYANAWASANANHRVSAKQWVADRLAGEQADAAYIGFEGDRLATTLFRYCVGNARLTIAVEKILPTVGDDTELRKDMLRATLRLVDRAQSVAQSQAWPEGLSMVVVDSDREGQYVATTELWRQVEGELAINPLAWLTVIGSAKGPSA